MQQSDLIIIGGGIVGLATAYRFLERFPGKRVTVLEKEADIARHQTGRNSGVLHTGIYYRPGSLKARTAAPANSPCRSSARAKTSPSSSAAKSSSPTMESELPRMEALLERGPQNGVVCNRITPEQIRELEPHAAGLAGIHIPEAGVVDYAQVCRRLAEIVTAQGSSVVTSARVTGIRRDNASAVVESTAGEFAAKQVVNCAGLYSDRVTRLSGVKPSAMIVPFRGEFYALREEARHLVRMLIYPVPDPKYPFLGVHFTRRINGLVECGPNAVLAFAREGYRNTTVNVRDLTETLTFPGFWRLSMKYWKIGADEMWRSFSKRAFVRALQRLVPAIESKMLDWAPAGVRAQAVGRDGSMLDDFVIEETDRVVNVTNAPSPAATASLNVGKLVVDRLAPRFDA